MGGLKAVLGLGTREHVALVGAGGKTSLMFALAEELQILGQSVVTSTTTKVWQRETSKAPCTIYIDRQNTWRERLEAGLRSHGHVFLGKEILDTGKIQGISPSLLDEIYQAEGMDCLIVEADGSAGHPVKAPDEHEPVIPGSATVVVAMMGIEAMGQPVGPETIFRMDIFNRLTGAEPGQVLTGDLLTGLFTAPEGLFKGAPDAARRVVFLNKTDIPAHEGIAGELAGLIWENASPPVDRIAMGSIKKGVYRSLFP
ncbi:selenium cofactor biosynthesis protein YqeC [Thermodesulfobacteriota bacterium]